MIKEKYYVKLLDSFNHSVKDERLHLEKAILFHQDDARLNTCVIVIEKSHESGNDNSSASTIFARL